MRNNQRPTTKRAPCLTEPCVQIPIRFESTTSNNAEQPYTASLRDEWQMLELQGNLSARPDKNKSLDGFNLGQLMPPNALNNNKCELVIGRQKCDGKQQEMKKPLVVLEKVVPSSTTTDMSDNSSPSSFVHYRIVGVIRDKLHFANRPVPLSPSKSKNHQVNTTTIRTSDSQSQSTTSSAVTGNDNNNNNSSSSSTVAEDQQSKKTKQQQATKNIHPMFLPKKPQPQKKKQP